MPLYRYVKTVPKKPMPRPVFLSYVFMLMGAGVILWTVWPIVSFFVFDQGIVSQMISPVAEATNTNKSLSPYGYASTSITANANYWFPQNPQKKVVTPVNSYELSIPTLKLQKATVVIAGDDLTKSLVHYGGTGLPGDYGTAVIFGHSTLTQLYNGVKAYKAIFSTLPMIKIGDEIIIRYDMVTYTYKVYDKVILEPTDLSTLEQNFDDSYLTLVTCVPPGTLLYRLNVKAKLERI
jgi:sortase A